jgi:signal transduction histidine kinase
VRRLIFVAFALAQCGLAHGSSLDAAERQDPWWGNSVITYDEAEWISTSDDLFPDADAPWQTVPLPDHDATLRHEGSALGARPSGARAPVHWYRIRLKVDAPHPDRLAVYIPRYGDRATIYVNYVEVHRSYLHSNEVTHGWNAPLWAILPAVTLMPGDNEILIRLDSPYTGPVLLARPRIGHPVLLERDYRRAYLWRITAAQVTCWLLAGLGVLAIILWAVRRQDVLHLLLGLGAFAFSARMLHNFVQVPFVSADFFWWVAVASLPWTLVLSFLFAYRYYGLRHPYVERLLIGVALLCTIIIFPGVGFDAYSAASTIYILLSPIGLMTAALLMQRAWLQRGAPQILLAVGIGFNYFFAIHDLLVMTRVVSFEHPYLMPVGAGLLFLCFTLALGARYIDSLQEVEQLNRSLEARVREREAALTQSFEQLRVLGEEQVLTEERQRLMREIHDGIGANLVATLATVERATPDTGVTVTALRRAISDLKLTIDSLEPVDGDLPSLLGNLRYRLTPQLRQAGIEIDWDVIPLPALEWLRAPQALHVLRILQEAFGNVIQHAAAKRVRVSTALGLDPADAKTHGVLIRLSDDGKGFDQQSCDENASSTHGGKGLRNMAWRANALGGHLKVSNNDSGGGCIELWLPVQQNPRPEAPQS